MTVAIACHRCSIVTESVSLNVFEIFGPKDDKVLHKTRCTKHDNILLKIAMKIPINRQKGHYTYMHSL